ncbi:hypothetical protein H6G00_02010 [Leptolyngbya sp. FACHB-541]|uniref:hypothetical protein n=1 Tax=Leptolyngbya sp. FACHB-541 TaxID=2692810 RepID=UPI001687AFCD|nr:hypothetical protein [Leptolyngbya sp. FACHB-541]MBD1995407.1 hypothetical protein [Leptolyngbya sp. FACHB-541]
MVSNFSNVPLVDPEFEDLGNIPVGEWVMVVHSKPVNEVYLYIRGRHCIIALKPRPQYCNRGKFLAVLDVLDGAALHIDSHDGWYPGRYYFDRDRAMLEINAWLEVRGQLTDDSPSA